MAAGGNNAGRGRDYRKPKDVQRTLRRLGRYLWNYPSLLFLVLAATVSQSILGLASSYLLLSLIHISEPTRQAEISYAVFCLKKKKTTA